MDIKRKKKKKSILKHIHYSGRPGTDTEIVFKEFKINKGRKRKALSPIFFHLSAFGHHKTRQTGQKAVTSSNKEIVFMTGYR